MKIIDLVYIGVFWDKKTILYNVATNKLVLMWIGNFIDNPREITQLK